jgi:hypothetical protein
LYDRKEPSLYPLEKVKDNIVKAILEDKRRVAVENYIDQLKEKAKIERS